MIMFAPGCHCCPEDDPSTVPDACNDGCSTGELTEELIVTLPAADDGLGCDDCSVVFEGEHVVQYDPDFGTCAWSATIDGTVCQAGSPGPYGPFVLVVRYLSGLGGWSVTIYEESDLSTGFMAWGPTSVIACDESDNNVGATASGPGLSCQSFNPAEVRTSSGAATMGFVVQQIPPEEQAADLGLSTISQPIA